MAGGWVYMMTGGPRGTLYVGVTNDLMRRAFEHRTHLVSGFTKRHRLDRLVWFERHENIAEAIAREKTLKRWRRAWKVELVESANPTWSDLYPALAR